MRTEAGALRETACPFPLVAEDDAEAISSVEDVDDAEDWDDASDVVVVVAVVAECEVLMIDGRGART